VHAVHDISEGGLACAAAEMALASGVGLEVDFLHVENREKTIPIRDRAFSEDQGRYLIAAPAAVYDRMKLGSGDDFPAQHPAGKVGGDDLRFAHGGDLWFDLPLSKLRAAHEGWLPAYMKG